MPAQARFLAKYPPLSTTVRGMQQMIQAALLLCKRKVRYAHSAALCECGISRICRAVRVTEGEVGHQAMLKRTQLPARSLGGF